VESEPGKGAAFTIHLPLHEEAPSEAATSGTDVPVPVAGRTCVMLVDDEQILLDVGGEILRDLGHEVITCKNGAEAVDRYREDGRRIGLVILDIVMPKMGGADAFTALRAIDPGVKVLVSSGYSIDGEARTLLDAGALGFLQKPFNRAELTRKVAEAL